MLLDLIFPPQCLLCRIRVDAHGTLCLSCWQQVHFITEPYCACCGLPFEYTLGENALCGDCIRLHPSFSRARAAFKYDECSSRLITALKFNDQSHLAAIYGAWLAKAGQELLAASDLIVPVPLHWRRFVGRRYNQSALLAQALGTKSGLTVLADGLKRRKHTAPQTGLTRDQRKNNVRGAFAVNKRHEAAIQGKSILLLDDVMTTSATVDQCAKALLKGGAATVNVLTLARKI